MAQLCLILHGNISRCEFTKKVYIYEIFCNKIYKVFIVSVLCLIASDEFY